MCVLSMKQEHLLVAQLKWTIVSQILDGTVVVVVDSARILAAHYFLSACAHRKHLQAVTSARNSKRQKEA